MKQPTVPWAKIPSLIFELWEPRYGLYSLDAAQFQGRNLSKEADGVYKPVHIRSCGCDWPTIVFESGLSESLDRLRTDAEWWLIESRGQVKIALLISVKAALSAIRIEKWELGLAHPPMTQTMASNAHHAPQVLTYLQALTLITAETDGSF